MYQFPYTNFHDLDLDWILNQVKSVVENNNALIESLNSPDGERFNAIVDATKTAIENDTSEDGIFARLKKAEEDAIDAAGRANSAAENAEDVTAMIAPAYSTSSTYYKGEYSAYSGVLYRANTKTTGAFDPTAWDAVTAGGMFELLTKILYSILGTTENVIQINKIKSPYTKNGLELTWTDNGTMTINGTTTANSVWIAIFEGTIPAGTYYFKGNPPESKLLYQVYRLENGVNVGQIKQGYENSTFTITEDTDILFRFIVSTSGTTFENFTFIPSLVNADVSTIPHFTAIDYTARKTIDNANTSIQTNSANIQTINNTRYYTYGVTAPADANEMADNGFYLMPYNKTNVTNLPTNASGRSVLIVNKLSDNYIMQTYIHGGSATNSAVYVRVYAANIWVDWIAVANLNTIERKDNETIFDYYSRYNYTGSEIPNVGERINILSYNVANFNHDTATYINDAQLVALRNVLFEIAPDFAGIEENRQFIDSGNNMSSSAYVWRPALPYIYGIGGNVIAARQVAINNGIVSFSNGRNARFATFEINNKTVLFVTAHPVADYNETGALSTDSIAARLVQYTELFQFIHGEITLNSYGTTTPINCPAHDSFIICMDSNALTPEDLTNLSSIAYSYNCHLANGGAIGWMRTVQDKTKNYAIDNIITSPDVIINSVKVYTSKANDLYSDHVPVSANVTITDSTP